MNVYLTPKSLALRALALLALVSVHSAWAGAQAPAPIAALYETRIDPKQPGAKSVTTRWYFWRDESQIEVRDEHGHTGERWERDPSGKLFYARLYHDERTQIEFAPTEFQVIGLNWNKVSSLIDPATLGNSLKPLRSAKSRATIHYRGNDHEQRIDVGWRPDLSLPSEIRAYDAHKTTTVKLIRSWPLNQAPQKMIDRDALAAFRVVDGADLGDMESDPFVMRVLSQADHKH